MHHVADVNGTFDLHPLPLRVLLGGLVVLPTKVDTVDDDSFTARNGLHDFASGSFVVAGNNDHLISSTNVHHTTS